MRTLCTASLAGLVFLILAPGFYLGALATVLYVALWTLLAPSH